MDTACSVIRSHLVAYQRIYHHTGENVATMTASRLSVTAPEMGEPIKLKLFSSPLVNGDGKVVNTDDEEDDATVKEFIPQLRRVSIVLVAMHPPTTLAGWNC